MIFYLFYYFIRISFYFGLGTGLFGLYIGIIESWYKIAYMINVSYTTVNVYPTINNYKESCISIYNCFIECVNFIAYFTAGFFVGGLVIPSCILFLIILYFINKYNQYYK